MGQGQVTSAIRADSRFIGMVPRHLLIGRAHRIVVSADMLCNWMPRWERVGARIQ